MENSSPFEESHSPFLSAAQHKRLTKFAQPIVAIDQESLPSTPGPSSVRDALEWPVTLRFAEMPLNEVVRSLGRGLGFELLIAQRALEDEGIECDIPITISVHNARLKDALSLMLNDKELTWTIRNEKLLITTRDEAQSHLETRIYPVRDLVAIKDFDESYDDYDSLIELITRTLAPDSWSDAGGNGSIEPFNNGRLLVISQTMDVQEQIVGLVTALRRARRLQGMGGNPNFQPVYLLLDEEITVVADQQTNSVRTMYSNGPPAAWQIPRVHAPITR